MIRKGRHLVSKKSYKDFEIRTEFWAATDTESGIFIRATDPNNIGSVSSFRQGPFSLQYGGGVKGAPGGPIKRRKVEISELWPLRQGRAHFFMY